MDALIDEQIQELRVQGTWVKRALAAKGDESASSSPSASTNGNAEASPKRRRGNKREAIRTVMRTDPDHVWLPSEVRAGLLEQGIDSTVEAVRVALRRMGDHDEVVRGEDGNGWKLAPTNGAAPEGPQPLDLGAPSLGPGGKGGSRRVRLPHQTRP